MNDPQSSEVDYAKQARESYQSEWAYRQQVSDRQILDRRKRDATFGDYLKDIPTGAVEGGVKAIGAIGDLADRAGGGSSSSESPLLDITNNTWTGNLSSGIGEFAAGYLVPGSIAGRVGKAYQVGKKGAAALGLAAGAVADFTAFQGDNGRLSDLIQAHPILANPVSKFLSSQPDDNWAEKRLKGALEGMGLGVAAEFLLHSLRGIRATKAGNTEVAAEASASLEKLASEHPAFLEGTDTGAFTRQAPKDVSTAFDASVKLPDVPPTALPGEVLHADQPRKPFTGEIPGQMHPPTDPTDITQVFEHGKVRAPGLSATEAAAEHGPNTAGRTFGGAVPDQLHPPIPNEPAKTGLESAFADTGPFKGSLPQRSPLTPPDAPTARFVEGTQENLTNVLC